jgi:hypothetical protein
MDGIQGSAGSEIFILNILLILSKQRGKRPDTAQRR